MGDTIPMGDTTDNQASALLVVMTTDSAGICHTWLKIAGKLNLVANLESHVS